MLPVSVCDECLRTRRKLAIRGFRKRLPRSFAPDRCYLDAGIVCCGMVTRAGCDALCPGLGSPCIGCLGHDRRRGDFERLMLRELAALVPGDDEPAQRLVSAGLAEPGAVLRNIALAQPAMRERLCRWGRTPRGPRRPGRRGAPEIA